MADTPPIPRAPRGLDTAGKALWRDLWKTFDFTDEPHLIAVLTQACRTQDAIEKLDAAMEHEPLTVSGSRDQLIIHPIITESRFQRKTLSDLLGRLGLPDNGDNADAVDLKARRSAAGRTAANARWKRAR